MALPTQRHTKSKRNRRRSHIHLSTMQLSHCSKCGKASLPHRLCENCGTYKGMQFIDVMAKLTKKEQRDRARQEKEEEKEKARKELTAQGITNP